MESIPVFFVARFPGWAREAVEVDWTSQFFRGVIACGVKVTIFLLGKNVGQMCISSSWWVRLARIKMLIDGCRDFMTCGARIGDSSKSLVRQKLIEDQWIYKPFEKRTYFRCPMPLTASKINMSPWKGTIFKGKDRLPNHHFWELML